MRFLVGLALGATLFTATAPLFSSQPVSAKPVVCPESVQGLECNYYQDGYKAGRKDRKANMSMFHGRHSDAYDSRFEPSYKKGYEAGWKGKEQGDNAAAPAETIKCPDTWDGLQCDYYKSGYKAGREDRAANMSMFHGRHSGNYDSRFEPNYQAGYEDGWKGTSN